MSTKITVLEEEAPSTNENSQSQQSEHGSESVLALAREAGEAAAESRHAQEEISELRARIAILEAERVDTAALRSELAQLRAEVFEMEETLEETENPDVTLIEPDLEPEPVKEEPPEETRESIFGIILRL